MMNKMKSAKVHLMRFLFSLPLIALVLLSFRNNISMQSKDDLKIPRELVIYDTVPAPEVAPVKQILPKDVISMVSVNNEITIALKNGKKEKYNLNNPDEKAAFHKKYGEQPAPPAPPAPPAAPAAPSNLLIPSKPAIPALPSNVSSIHINNEKATIGLKDSQVEHYDLKKPAEKEAFEKKYGELVPSVPKPPTPPEKTIVTSTLTVVGIEPVVAVDMVEPEVLIATTVSADVMEVEAPIILESPIEKYIIITELSNKTTRAELEQVRKQLLQKGYTLSVNSTGYVDGVLQSIEGSIADGSSKARFIGQDFNKIVITKLTYQNGKSAFHIKIVAGLIKM